MSRATWGLPRADGSYATWGLPPQAPDVDAPSADAVRRQDCETGPGVLRPRVGDSVPADSLSGGSA